MRHHHAIVFGVVTILLLGGCSSRPPVGEGLVQVTGKFPGQAEVPFHERQTRFILNQEKHQPPNVVQDLQKLGDAMVAQGLNLERATVHASPNGRAVVASSPSGLYYIGAPTGVWLWPDWRDAAAVIHFREYSEVKFLSNYHLRIKHYPRDTGISTSHVIDWRNPDHRFQFTGFWLHMLCIADNGRWACAKRDGSLVVGWLNPNDPRWMDNTITIPVEREVTSLMFRRHGSILIVDFTPEEEMSGQENLKAFRLTDHGAVETASVQGYLYSDQCALADDSFFVEVRGNRTHDLKMATVSSEGVITLHGLPGFSRWFDEAPVQESPSGRYATTYIDGLIPASYSSRLRRTPKAARDGRMPSFPDADERIGGGMFWLAWDQPTTGTTP